MARGSIRWATRFAPWELAPGLGFAALPVAAQAPVPLGPEFQINAGTTSYDTYPIVATAGDGGFVVVWDSLGSSGTDTSGSSIQGWRYASDGAAQGPEFEVDTFMKDSQQRPSVAADASGKIVVAWQCYDSNGPGNHGLRIKGQRYSGSTALEVPALSRSAGLALGATLMALGAIVARAYQRP